MICRTLPAEDPSRFWTAFSDALRATGVDPEGRDAGFVRGGCADQYHYFVWGPDSLDCHAYGSRQLVIDQLTRSTTKHPALPCDLANCRGIIYVEAAPIPDWTDPVHGKRVALAVAALIDQDTRALLYMPSNALALCTPTTAGALRADWGQVFGLGDPDTRIA